jgi:hypothetical protein
MPKAMALSPGVIETPLAAPGSAVDGLEYLVPNPEELYGYAA